MGLLGHEEGNHKGINYQRKIDFHKLQEEEAQGPNTFFVRHCGSTRRCAKLFPPGSTRWVLYAYNGQGLDHCRRDWWSVVVRVRSLDLVARVLHTLAPPCSTDSGHIVDNVSSEDAELYKKTVAGLKDRLLGLEQGRAGSWRFTEIQHPTSDSESIPDQSDSVTI